MNVQKIDRWLNNTHEGTWFAHWVQGFAFFLLGAIRSFDLGAGLAAGAFLHREGSDFRKAVKQLGWRQAIRVKLLDGIGDALFAGLGAFTGLLLVGWGLWAGAGGLAGSAAAWWIMSQVPRRNRAKG